MELEEIKVPGSGKADSQSTCADIYCFPLKRFVHNLSRAIWKHVLMEDSVGCFLALSFLLYIQQQPHRLGLDMTYLWGSPAPAELVFGAGGRLH